MRQGGRQGCRDQWPSGFRDTLIPIDEVDRPLCQAVASSLVRLGPMPEPLKQDRQFKFRAPWPQLDWQPVPKDRLLPLAQQFEIDLRQRWRHPVDNVTSKPFLDLLAARVRSGELDIAIAPHPVLLRQPSGEPNAVYLVRYQRWAKDSATTDMDSYQPVEFFRSEDLQITRFDVLGSGEDAFVYQGHAYVASLSSRRFDNAWQQLPLAQPELTVSKADSGLREVRLVTACRLLYVGPL